MVGDDASSPFLGNDDAMRAWSGKDDLSQHLRNNFGTIRLGGRVPRGEGEEREKLRFLADYLTQDKIGTNRSIENYDLTGLEAPPTAETSTSNVETFSCKSSLDYVLFLAEPLGPLAEPEEEPPKQPLGKSNEKAKEKALENPPWDSEEEEELPLRRKLAHPPPHPAPILNIEFRGWEDSISDA